MSRRKKSGTDSLELLLDTICNTFGGVLFIAILVIILLQLSGPPVPSSTSSRSSVQSENLRKEIATLHSEKLRLQALLSAQSQTLDVLAPDNLQQQMTLRDQERSHQSELKNRIERERRLLKDDVESQSELEQSVMTLEREVAQEQSKRQALGESIEREQQAQITELRTSQVRDPGLKRQIIAVIQFDRFYLWHEYDASGRRIGLNNQDFLILESSVQGVETTPNPLKGLSLAETEDVASQLSRAFKRFSNRESYVAVVVRPDSFGTFHIVRDALIQQGLEYQLIPATEDDSYTDRGGQGGRVQ